MNIFSKKKYIYNINLILINIIKYLLFHNGFFVHFWCQIKLDEPDFFDFILDHEWELCADVECDDVAEAGGFGE